MAQHPVDQQFHIVESGRDSKQALEIGAFGKRMGGRWRGRAVDLSQGRPLAPPHD